ncbi:MAG: hypothetical protein O3B31_01455 [Chloroflexi bacterium]|nr:hypothetical protein [Chloroflexota bacterium]MDA1002007.1 hypothetical protein [Chloroflexota bacterium]
MRAPTLVGLAIVLIAAAALAAILLIDRAGGVGGTAAVATAIADAAAEGVTVEPALTTNMRTAPDRLAELVAIIPGGRAAQVTGQSADGAWLLVVYPIGSRLEGWVPAANVIPRTGDPATVPVIDVASSSDASPASTTGTPVAAGGAEPDLQVTNAFVAPNGTLTIRFANVGRGAFDAATSLRVTSAAGAVIGVVDIERTLLRPGRSATVNTQIAIERTGEYVLEADWLDEVTESNEFNNTLRTLLVSVTP